MFVGYVDLEQTLNAPVVFRDAARTPVNTDGPPTVRIYSPDGLLPAVTTVASQMDAGTIQGVSSDTPIVITSPGHGLTGGTYVTVQGVLGNTGANGSFTVTVIDQDTFSLDGSVTNGTYTTGGAWNVAGLYIYSVPCTSANGFEAGTTYYALIQATVAGVPTSDDQTFIVT